MADKPEKMLRRSLMYTPASRMDRVQKALEAGKADVIVADLEDGTAPADKAKAREEVARFLKAPPKSRSHLAVRINPWPGATGHADIAALRANPPATLVLPKVESMETVNGVAAMLGDHGRNVRFLVLVESAKGVLNAQSICTAPRVDAVIFGAEDYAASVGAVRTKEGPEVLYARSHVVACAAAAGIDAIDLVYPDFKDPAGFAKDLRAGIALGYTGKQLIHPDQIEPTHRGFAPTPEEIAKAKQIVEASEKAGGGVVVVDDRMIDRPLVEQARRVIKRSQAPA
jgi:citrate lyase subunit beta / citryl-CoA lyase